MSSIAPLDPSMVDVAAAALVRAFGADPVITYVFPDDAGRAEGAQALFGALIRHGLTFGVVYTDDPANPQGVGVWLPPGAWQITPERAAQSGLDQLPALIGDAAAGRFLMSAMTLMEYHMSDPPTDHWYGLLGGVAPGAQGRWLGRAFLEPVCKLADQAGVPVYVEVNDLGTYTLYTRGAGFRVLRDFVDPASGIRFWTLLRDPRTGEYAGRVRRIPVGREAQRLA